MLEQVIVDYFLNRTDRLANLAPWGIPCPIDPGEDLRSVIRAHLGQGAFDALHIPSKEDKPPRMAQVNRIGTYTPAPDGTTVWICVDLDGKGHAAALEDPLGVADKIIQRLARLGFPAHLERSGGGQGFHVWVFFDRPTSAMHARLVAFSVLPKARLTSGDQADPRSNKGIEVFPKAEQIEEGGLGNMVWLPWWAGAPQDCGEFYREEPEGWYSYEPSGFERASADDLERYAAELAKQQAKKEASRQRANTAGSSDWASWRSKAVEALDLERVYGPWLTGKRDGRGWLECRDPESPSGDRRPSASVSTGATKAERGTFHSQRTSESIRVFDFMIRYCGFSDIAAAQKAVAEWTGIPLPKTKKKRERSPPAAQRPTAPPSPSDDERPMVIVNGRQVTDVIRDAWSAVLRCKTPRLYVRSHELVRIRDGKYGKQIHPMTKEATYGALLRSARWVKAKQSEKSGTYYVDDKPQHELAADLMAYPHPSLRRLEAVLPAPTFAYDGRLIDKPGYDEEQAIFYDERARIPPIPDRPTFANVDDAKALIDGDLFVNFPFTSPADKAAAWAALFAPFLRRMIPGSTPLHLIEAPTAGSGKGLLADLVWIAFTGREAEVTTMPTDEEEIRKKLTSLLKVGKPLITFDNLPWGSKSANLAASITAHTWSDRVLGKQEMVELENRACWYTTVNNPDFNVDLARRCIRIRISPNDDRPWERTKFKHANLREWAKDHRAEIVQAILTLIRFWVADGMPRGERTLGSFEAWSRTLGGLLDTIGVPAFLENAKDLYDQADTDSSEWAEFVRAWWACFTDDPVQSRALVDMAKNYDLLQTVRGDRGPSSQSIRMGKALARMRGRVVDGWRIEMRTNQHSKSREYALEPLTEEARKPLFIRDLTESAPPANIWENSFD